MTHLIRVYHPHDVPFIKKVHFAALQENEAVNKDKPWNADLDHIEETYIHGGTFLVGEVDGKIVSMGALKKISDKVAEVKRIRVHPDYQRKGFGQQMLEALEQKAVDLGFRTLQLDTTIHQVAAQKLYEKNEYREVRRETEGLPFESIFYEKELA